MKYLVSILIFVISSGSVFAQLKKQNTCPTFVVDVLDGHINKYSPKSTLAEIKNAFPCYTEVIEVATSGNCVTIAYADKGVYYFPERNYWEIRENFKGKLTVPLLGANRKDLFKTLGNAILKDQSWDAFKTNYGILVLYYNKSGRVNKLQMSNRTTDSIKLCE